MIAMEKILISACLLGEAVRYDGNSKLLDSDYIEQWRKQGRLVSICPEVAGGLSVPRPAAEVISRQPLQVATSSEIDVTRQFELGAAKALTVCQAQGIRYALLKERSPSCGSQQNYDGSFTGKVIEQPGVTAALLITHGIQVFSEETIQALAQLLEEQSDVDSIVSGD